MNQLTPAGQPKPANPKSADWAGVRWEQARTERAGRVFPGTDLGWTRRSGA